MKDEANSWEARASATALYGFTDLPTIAERGPIVLERGEGPHVFDVHGRRYLDGNSGLWNMVAGFSHAGIAEAARAQYDRLPGYHAFFGRLSDRTVELSERLIALSPWERGRVFYTNSGSEANDTLVKMLWFLGGAEGRPERRTILTRWGGYHGVTAVSASMTGKPYNALFGLPLPGFVHLTCPHFWREGREGETEAAFVARLAAELEETIAREGPETIAALVAEPVLGAGGAIPPPEGYFAAIHAVLRRHGIPLVADEVICGFGRTGEVWGHETHGFVPDAIIASKALTAGYFPMGAVMLGPDLADRLHAASEAAEEFPHGFTASGHPVGCAVALRAIEAILEEGLLENVRALAPRFAAGLRDLAERHPHIGEARSSGLMGAIEAVREPGTKEPFPPSAGMGERIANACADRGLICRPLGPAIVLCPPFILTDAQMDEIFSVLDDALSASLP
jgi:adenosylmethionine-8-amino-7-oxononanoate aminotransferase